MRVYTKTKSHVMKEALLCVYGGCECKGGEISKCWEKEDGRMHHGGCGFFYVNLWICLSGTSEFVLANDIDLETNLTQLGSVDQETTIEEEGRLVHASIDLFIVKVLITELVPLGDNDNSIGTFSSFISATADLNVLLNLLAGIDNAGLREIHVDLLMLDLGVIDSDTSVFLDKVLDQGDSSRLTGVTSILLESKTKHSNLFVGDGVEQGGDNLANETLLLVLVHDHDLLPVSSDLGQVQLLRQVDQVEDILLEA